MHSQRFFSTFDGQSSAPEESINLIPYRPLLEKIEAEIFVKAREMNIKLPKNISPKLDSLWTDFLSHPNVGLSLDGVSIILNGPVINLNKKNNIKTLLLELPTPYFFAENKSKTSYLKFSSRTWDELKILEKQNDEHRQLETDNNFQIKKRKCTEEAYERRDSTNNVDQTAPVNAVGISSNLGTFDWQMMGTMTDKNALQDLLIQNLHEQIMTLMAEKNNILTRAQLIDLEIAQAKKLMDGIVFKQRQATPVAARPSPTYTAAPSVSNARTTVIPTDVTASRTILSTPDTQFLESGGFFHSPAGVRRQQNIPHFNPHENRPIHRDYCYY